MSKFAPVQGLPVAVQAEAMPTAPVAAVLEVEAMPRPPADEQLRRLGAMGLPPGICEGFVESGDQFGARFWIVDNSGSMQTQDGKRLAGGGQRRGLVTASRWEELGDALAFHGGVASALGVPTEFLLLNQPAGALKRVVCGVGDAHREAAAVAAVVASAPTGRTPLCRAVGEVVGEVRACAPALAARGQRALVVIASDGEASDGDVLRALAPLRDLPVWVVVRLCTDDDRVVTYWNDVDEEIELEMDVLDDLVGEADEVTDHQPWLTYGSELHRLREWGCTRRVVDLLDEKPLSLGEVPKLAALVLGPAAADLPHPELDWKGFLQGIDAAQQGLYTWDPKRRAMKPWFDVRKMHKVYKGGGCVVM